MKNVLSNLSISMDIRKLVSGYHILPILLYVGESWTQNKSKKKLEAAEMRFFHNRLRIPQAGKRVNIQVPEGVTSQRHLITNFRSTQSIFGHVMRLDNLEKVTATGKILDARAEGWQQIPPWVGKVIRKMISGEVDQEHRTDACERK